MHVVVKISEDTIILLQVSSVMNCLLKMLRLNFGEKTNWVVANFFPQFWIQLFIQSKCFWVPTPPKIIGHFVEPTDAGRHGREDRHAAKNFHRIRFLYFNYRASESSHDGAHAQQQRYDR